MTIDSFFSKLYSSNLGGKEIDQGLLVILGNLLKDKPVFSLPLKDTRHLSRMIHESSKSFTFLDGGIFYWCA